MVILVYFALTLTLLLYQRQAILNEAYSGIRKFLCFINTLQLPLIMFILGQTELHDTLCQTKTETHQKLSSRKGEVWMTGRFHSLLYGGHDISHLGNRKWQSCSHFSYQSFTGYALNTRDQMLPCLGDTAVKAADSLPAIYSHGEDRKTENEMGLSTTKTTCSYVNPCLLDMNGPQLYYREWPLLWLVYF